MGCCCLGSYVLPLWGCLKLIVSVPFLIYLVNFLIAYQRYLPLFYGVVLCILTIQLFIDFVLQTMLVVAYYKKKESRLIAYFTYTIFLWVMALILGAMFYIFSQIYRTFNQVEKQTENVIFHGLINIFVSALIQTIIWNTIIKEQAITDQTRPVSKDSALQDFILQIEVRNFEKIRKQGDNMEAIVIEKSKLDK